jgi:nucleosome assembly protein 1-like 1
MSGTAIPGSHADLTAPTPQNTPLQAAPITSGLSRPTVPDIGEADEDAEDDGPGGGVANALQSAVQARLAGLLGQSSGYIENLPLKTRTNVAALKGVQAGATALAAQYRREVWALEQKVRPICRVCARIAR